MEALKKNLIALGLTLIEPLNNLNTFYVRRGLGGGGGCSGMILWATAALLRISNSIFLVRGREYKDLPLF